MRAGRNLVVWVDSARNAPGRATADQIATEAKRAASHFGLSPDVVLEIPHFLVGTVDQMVETLQRRREEYGFSYIVISGGGEETMAPVVARLAGT